MTLSPAHSFVLFALAASANSQPKPSYGIVLYAHVYAGLDAFDQIAHRRTETGFPVLLTEFETGLPVLDKKGFV